MPGFTLDQMAERFKAREEKRKKNGAFFLMDGEGAKGGWNAADIHERNNWNLTTQDMEDLEEALAEYGEFTTDAVVSKESTLEQVNEGLTCMRQGDVSMFTHLPPTIREYYGRKSLQEFFGADDRFPPLDDEMKKRLDDMVYKPEFRFAITKLIERNAIDRDGKPLANRLMEYDQYMSQRMLIRTISPIRADQTQRIVDKYGRDEAMNVIAHNKEKQFFFIKSIFMAQLGRIDIMSGDKNEIREPFTGQMSDLFSHGGRLAFTLPYGDEKGQDKMFDAWQKTGLDKDIFIVKRFASHEMHRRIVDDEGNTVKPFEEIKIHMGEQLSHGQLNKKLGTYINNYGLDLPIGGLGCKFNKYGCVDGDGSFGHMYIRTRKGEKNKCGAIMFGFENSSPGVTSCIGQLHNFKAISYDISPFMSNKTSVGKMIGGREVDLSHMKAEDLAKTLNDFEEGYRKLYRKAATDDKAALDLERVNSKLCGKYMTAAELTEVMSTVGMDTRAAKIIVEEGRSAKGANYDEEFGKYSDAMQKVGDPDLEVSDEITSSRMIELKNMSGHVDSLRRQWKQMSSHTAFSFMNSKEFTDMEKAFGLYLKAYDNILAGKTVDGKEFRAEPDKLYEKEYNKLRILENRMTKAGAKYHEAKVKQKEGGFDKHKSDQARDRDAMSLSLASFSDDSRLSRTADPYVTNKDIKLSKKDAAVLDKAKNERAREDLDNKVKGLKDEAELKKAVSKKKTGKKM